MLDTFLNEPRYQDMPKDRFIRKLALAFDKMKAEGNEELSRIPGTCGVDCGNKGCTGFSFVGDKTGNYINVIIEAKEGRVTDLYECSSFETGRPKSGRRLWIDNIWG